MRKLFKNGYEIDKKAIKKLDGDSFVLIQNLQRASKTTVRIGELAKKLSVNSIEMLGSFERIKPRLRKAKII